MCPRSLSQEHNFSRGVCVYCGEPSDELRIDKETAQQLLETLKHQYIKSRYTKVHELIRKLYEFTSQ